jgi:hypothetical protein
MRRSARRPSVSVPASTAVSVRAERVGPRTILVFEDLVETSNGPVVGGLGLYSRVSSHDQKADRARQVERLRVWASVTGVPVIADVSEVGAGMNGSRPKLRKLLANPGITTIVVEHRDGLGRMNTELVESAHRVRSTACGRGPGRVGRRSGSRHDGGSHLVLRPIVWAPVGGKPGQCSDDRGGKPGR